MFIAQFTTLSARKVNIRLPSGDETQENKAREQSAASKLNLETTSQIETSSGRMSSVENSGSESSRSLLFTFVCFSFVYRLEHLSRYYCDRTRKSAPVIPRRRHFLFCSSRRQTVTSDREKQRSSNATQGKRTFPLVKETTLSNPRIISALETFRSRRLKSS